MMKLSPERLKGKLNLSYYRPDHDTAVNVLKAVEIGAWNVFRDTNDYDGFRQCIVGSLKEQFKQFITDRQWDAAETIARLICRIDPKGSRLEVARVLVEKGGERLDEARHILNSFPRPTRFGVGGASDWNLLRECEALARRLPDSGNGAKPGRVIASWSLESSSRLLLPKKTQKTKPIRRKTGSKGTPPSPQS